VSRHAGESANQRRGAPADIVPLSARDNPATRGVVIPQVRRGREHRRITGRDEAEFEEFAARDGGRLLGFALLLTGDRQDAEDLVQMALLRSAGRWSAAREQPEGYTRAVLVNLARDRWRVRRRHRTEPLGDDVACRAAAAAGDAVLDRHMLLRACRGLPVQQRAVLVLRFWEDRTVDETAAVLGCTPGTVKSHTHRALARLRLALHEAPELRSRPDREEAPC
jgi:RNA polymerase sigma-70 factor (sigma-E family)